MEANGSIGFRKILKHRSEGQTVELPRIGILDDGRPFAVRFRQLSPVEWWSISRGRRLDGGVLPGNLPMDSGDKRSEDDEMADAMADEKTVQAGIERFEYACAVIGVAVVSVRDCVSDGNGSFTETWNKCEVVGAGTGATELPDGTALLPIELFHDIETMNTLLVAIGKHANFGGNKIQEVPFRGGTADVREGG